MNAGGRRVGAVLIRVAVVAVALALLARGIQWANVWRYVREARPALLFGVVALNAVVMAIRAARLRLLIAPREATVATCLQAIVSSAAINNVLPLRGGDVARLWMLERSTGLPKATGVAVTLFERVTDIAALGLLVIPAALTLPSQRWAVIAGAGALASAVVILFVVKTFMGKTFVAAAPDLRSDATRPSWKQKLDALRGFIDGGSPILRSAPAAARVMALSSAAWLVETAMVMTCASALHLHVSLALALVVLLGINLALVLPSTPSNAGPLEAAAVVVLLAGGFDKSHALAFALTYHIVQVLPVTIVGLVVAARVYGRPPGVRLPRI
jgi:glycosyltransferase 2 family protein